MPSFTLGFGGKMKVSKQWTQVFEDDGHKLSVSSGDKLLYLTIANETKGGCCVAITSKQLAALSILLDEAITTLQDEDKWDTLSKK